MRILLSIHHPLDHDAGAAGVVWHVGQALTALGHEVEYFSWDDTPALLPPRAKELLFPELACLRFSAAGREGFDVIETSTGDAWLWGTVRRGAHGRGPLLVTRSQGLEHRYSRARREQRRAAGDRAGWPERIYHDRLRLREVAASLRVSDVTIYGNAADRAEAVERFGLDARRAHVVRNGVADDLLTLPPPPPSRDGEPVTIAQLGTFDPRKGSLVALRALASVLAQRPGARVLMLGTGAAPELVRAGFSPGVRERVTVVSRYRREDLPSLLGGAQILIHPSLAEGFSLALLEGMACGLAPIASSVGAAPDLLAGGGAGILVPPGEASALTGALLRLIDRPDLREPMRAEAQTLAQRHTWQAAAEATLSAYRSGGEPAADGRR